MLFQTYEFVILLAVALLGVAILRSNYPQHLLLTGLSYLFYAWWDVRFLILLLVTSMVDYAAALGMDGVRLSWAQRARLSGVVLAGAFLTLVVNWPMLQHGDQPFSWDLLLAPEWEGLRVSVGACVLFAVAGPVIYGALFAFGNEGRRRAFLVTSVITNLAVLGFFKYYNFFTDSFAGIAHALGSDVRVPHLDVVLPVGISFYTFVSMSYTIDAYRREIPAERSFLRFAFFVSYFPHLVAGPIIRPQQLLPTLDDPWTLRLNRMASGLNLAAVGLVKKVLIADNVAPLANAILNDPAGQPSIAIMLGAALFAVQIYGDFSGYTDIARGVSRMFGVELPLNFDYPYFSTSIIEFWRRWHISLSTWLRDYLYIPLGGSRVGPVHLYANLMTTMVLGGLWHGASWNFVIWGAYQGALLCLNRLVRAVCARIPALDAFLATPAGTFLRWACTMYLVLLGWLIFRLTDFDHLLVAARSYVLFDGRLALSALGLGLGLPVSAGLAMLVFGVLHTYGFFTRRWADRLDTWPAPLLFLLYALIGFALFFGWPQENAPFIYFQF